MLKKREPKKVSSQESASATTTTLSRWKSAPLPDPRMVDPFMRVDPRLLEKMHRESVQNRSEEALI